MKQNNTLNKIIFFMVFIFYNLLQFILFPFFILLLPFLFLHKRFRYHFWNRIGFVKKSTQNNVWIHSASVGEWNGLLPFINILEHQNKPLIFSSYTDTGLKNIKQKSDKSSFILPFDFLLLQGLLFLQIKPKKLIIAETELWPNLIFLAHLFHIPLYLINARISDKYYKSYIKFKKFYQILLNQFDLILTQDKITLNRLKNFDIQTKCQFTGTTKLDGIQKLSLSKKEKSSFLKKIHATTKTKIITAGSVRGKEYQYFINAIPRLLKYFSDLKLLIVPRHIKNIPAYKKYLSAKKIDFNLWSENSKKKVPVILVDKMGLLQKLYAISHISFVGGTIEPIGGHNPVEAAVCQTAILHGNSISNNPIAFELLIKNKASIVVTKKTVYPVLLNLLKNFHLLKKLQTAPYKVLSSNTGVSKKVYNLIFSHNLIHSKKRIWGLPFVPLYYVGYKLDSTLKSKKQKTIPESFVISVGNLSVGGTGKTPFVILLAKALKNYKPAILTRGYKSKIKKVILRKTQKASLYGDEPVLLAQKTGVPVIVNSNRFEGASLVKDKHKLFILDDGFQHRQLHRDIDIVLINAAEGFTQKLLPVGNLREPFSALKRSHYIILTNTQAIAKTDTNRMMKQLQSVYKNAQVFYSFYKVEGIYKKERKAQIKNKKIFAFSGIGYTESFQNTIYKLFSNKEIQFKFWNDHHKYNKIDIALIKKYMTNGWAIVTTEKDSVKLREANIFPYTINIQTTLNNEKKFLSQIKKQVGEFYEKK